MSPDVLRAKLGFLYQILDDLKPHVSATRVAQEARHYEIERQVQLCVDLCVALGRRALLLRGFPLPGTSREVFMILAKKKLIPKKLGSQLGDAVGLRNLIVHEYGILDYGLFFGGLRDGYKAFCGFAFIVEKWIK